MGKTLFPYQQKIVDNEKRTSSALFMSMGTGKTVTSLALFKKSERPKILILCLISKMQDWLDDLKSECNMDAILLNKGSSKNMQLVEQNHNAYIINFESAWRCVNLLSWVDNDTYVLIDESHHIKTFNSKISKFCTKLKDKTKYKCILTGTPQSKGYIDYYNQLAFVDMMPMTYKQFCDKYCVYDTMKFNGYPFKKLVGYKDTDKLDTYIQNCCVFYDRKVDDELVPSEVDVKLPLPKVYNKFKRVRVYEDYAADSSSKLFVSMRTICSGFIGQYPVESSKRQWFSDFITDLSTRLVIFYNFNSERDDIIEMLKKHNIPYSEYNGREKDLTNFKENENGVAVCQYISASTGLNDLVCSNVCIMYSPPLNYTDWAQAKKRIDRIGQTKKPLYYHLYCVGSVEEKILNTIKSGQDFDERMILQEIE